MTEHFDQIIMEGMVFQGCIGVLDFEKTSPQPYQIDAVISCRKINACLSDNLGETIDYGQAYAIIRNIVETADCQLIERLAGLIATALLDCCSLAKAVEITVRKPKAPIEGDFSAMGVRIFRERN